MKWIYLCFFVLAAVVLAAADHAPPLNDYDDEYDYNDLIEEADKLDAENDQFNNDDAVKDYKDDDGIDYYQFEDNRDKPKDADADSDKNSPIENEEAKRKADQDDYALLWGDDSVAPLPVPDLEPAVDDEGLEETKNILENDFDSEIEKSLDNVLKSDNKTFEDTLNILDGINDLFETKDESVDQEMDDESFEKEAIKSLEELQEKIMASDQIIEETRKILEETGDSFGENVDEIKVNEEKVVKGDIVEKTLEENDDLFGNFNVDDENEIVIKDDKTETEEKHNIKTVEVSEDDTVDKVKLDLGADLDKLFETLVKLSVDDDLDKEKVEKLYKNIDEQIFKDTSEVLVEDNLEYEEVDFDKILLDINNEADSSAKNDDVPNAEIKKLANDELNEPNPDDAIVNDAESLPEKAEDQPILFQDAILDEPKEAESVEETKENYDDNDASIENNDDGMQFDDDEQSLDVDNKDADKPETMDINNLNSEELSDLVKQFSQVHLEELDAKDTIEDNAAEHIKLTVDEPVVVTSPNYPDAYPTNSVKDWLFTGDGVGIELNITDFLVNGAMGHYLLVKPGGVDDSGHEGLVFTYRLNSEKRFRFSDVDQLFVRFNSSLGVFGSRGFQLSARMIAPLASAPSPPPAPEPSLAAPHSVLTLHLALPPAQFQREPFRVLLAAMAEQYIEDNFIDPGLNSTLDVTQVTSVAACPVTWPSYEQCTAVTFGVSLTYEDETLMLDEESLRQMWDTYSTRDPFALRLSQLGITEFAAPARVIVPWLLVGSAVVLAAVLMVLALYRFNCFEDYTRMKDFNDADSLQNEKRGLDLYPTPHQTLPPLYGEHAYKWQDEDTTRVDMGGLANRSYARDMYDFESDDDVPHRNTSGA